MKYDPPYSDYKGNEGIVTALYDEYGEELDSDSIGVATMAKVQVLEGPEKGRWLIVQLDGCNIYPIVKQ
jgi:hypothetical protein